MDNPSSTRARGLDYFRRVVALLYREIGVITGRNHAELAAKAKSREPFFADRKGQAKQLYKLSLTDSKIEHTLARYERRTGLSLEDVRRAFAEGHWGDPPSFGGPKWGAVAAAAIQLGDAIDHNTWSEVDRLVHYIDGLQHNNGRVVSKFPQLD